VLVALLVEGMGGPDSLGTWGKVCHPQLNCFFFNIHYLCNLHFEFSKTKEYDFYKFTVCIVFVVVDFNCSR